MDPMQKSLKLALSLANMEQLCGCKKKSCCIDAMCTVIKICPKHWTWYNHWLLWNQTYSPTGWQWFLKLAGAHWVKSAAKSWLPVVFHVCVQILANYLLGCGKTWNRSPFPIRATLSHHFTTAWRIAGRAALPNGHSGQVARDMQLAHPKG